MILGINEHFKFTDQLIKTLVNKCRKTSRPKETKKQREIKIQGQNQSIHDRMPNSGSR